jgi:hypothetical protein
MYIGTQHVNKTEQTTQASLFPQYIWVGIRSRYHAVALLEHIKIHKSFGST